MQVDFTQEEIKNLMVFLGRVQLAGREVPALNAIVNKIDLAVRANEISKKKKQVQEPEVENEDNSSNV